MDAARADIGRTAFMIKFGRRFGSRVTSFENLGLTGGFAFRRRINMTKVSLLVLLLVFATLASGDVQRGFLDSGGSFSLIQYPGSNLIATQASGINDSGEIIGTYSGPPPHTSVHSYSLSAGVYTNIDYPGALDTYANGINDRGQIVGYYYAKPGHGYLLSGGIYTIINYPNTNETYPTGINDSDQIVGVFFQTGTSVAQGFLLSGGMYTTIDFPGAEITYVTGINDNGQIVGWYVGTNSFNGFLLTDGRYSTIAYPGSSMTVVSGINVSGEIVGYYYDKTSGEDHGFSYSGGSYTTLDSPWPAVTQPMGINDSGQIVGDVVGNLPTPEANTLLLLGSGVLGLAGVIRKKLNL
jgi:hypothetical protein